jgi:hypothetical protein
VREGIVTSDLTAILSAWTRYEVDTKLERTKSAISPPPQQRGFTLQLDLRYADNRNRNNNKNCTLAYCIPIDRRSRSTHSLNPIEKRLGSSSETGGQRGKKEVTKGRRLQTRIRSGR